MMDDFVQNGDQGQMVLYRDWTNLSSENTNTCLLYVQTTETGFFVQLKVYKTTDIKLCFKVIMSFIEHWLV